MTLTQNFSNAQKGYSPVIDTDCFSREDGIVHTIIERNLSDGKLLGFRAIRRELENGIRCIIESGYVIDNQYGLKQTFSGIHYEEDVEVVSPEGKFSSGKATRYHASREFSRLNGMLELKQ